MNAFLTPNWVALVSLRQAHKLRPDFKAAHIGLHARFGDVGKAHSTVEVRPNLDCEWVLLVAFPPLGTRLLYDADRLESVIKRYISSWLRRRDCRLHFQPASVQPSDLEIVAQ